MRYDAKKLPLNELDSHFKRALETISLCVRCISEDNEYDAELMQESAIKIIDRANNLPPSEATEMLEGLSQIMCIVSARIHEVNILTQFLSDPNFVPSEALAKIVQNPLLHQSCNLPESLTPHVPSHLLLAE